MRRGIVALTAVAVAWAPCSAEWTFIKAASAQQQPATAPPAAAAPPAADTVFTRAELETLLKPIALYPDPLLAQLLPASAYPLDIVQAARWLDRNKAAVEKADFTAADAMPWDASVKALLRFPDLIRQLNENLDWTSDLGDAFVNQPQDVATVIQDLRALAFKGGALQSTPQQKVVKTVENTREVITIVPAEPEVIFVPTYDPAVVYNPVGTAVVSGLIGFGTGILVGSLINNNYWNWGSGIVYPPVWPGYPAWRPPYPGYRPGVPPYPGWRPGGGNNINIGNDINIGGGNNIGIGNGNNLIGNSKPWRPDPDRYRPGQGTKPGLSRPAQRPGGVARPGDLTRPTTLPAIEGGLGQGLGGAGGAAIGGAVGGAIGGAVGSRPGGVTRPAPGDGPNLGNITRPGGGDGPATRPGGGARPETRPAVPNRPETRPAPSRPQTRPAVPDRPQARPAPRPAPSAFDRIDMGQAASQFGNRGAASRAQVSRPQGGGGGAAFRPGGGGGGAPAMRPSGGGRGGAAVRPAGGGGGPRAGGGGGARRR
ncbi:DUF3300 domain-containing protein [Alsobacter sp. R-9]